MRARPALVLPAIGFAMILAGCSDMGDPVKPGPPSGGTAVSYQNDVRPIFSLRGCLGCHTSGSTTDYTGILTSYGSFVNATSFTYPTEKIVKPFDPAGSLLYNKVEQTALFPPPMPLGMAQIPPSERDLIRRWILQGAQDN